jgi:hypothetical protein
MYGHIALPYAMGNYKCRPEIMLMFSACEVQTGETCLTASSSLRLKMVYDSPQIARRGKSLHSVERFVLVELNKTLLRTVNGIQNRKCNFIF